MLYSVKQGWERSRYVKQLASPAGVQKLKTLKAKNTALKTQERCQSGFKGIKGNISISCYKNRQNQIW